MQQSKWGINKGQKDYHHPEIIFMVIVLFQSFVTNH